jgi:O-antigen ligase/tetratricopeptide (TPR) repeat protein
MRAFEQTLRYIAIAGAFLLPFIVFYVATALFFPFITGKNFAFRILVEIMAAAWLGLALVSTEYRPKRSWILAAFAVFVLIIAIADAQGVYPFKSFWSNFERMDGWVTLAHLLAYLTVMVSVMNTENLWRWLFRLSLAVSVCVGLYGVLQLFGIRAVGQGGVTGLLGRLDSTLGNAIYLAVYMLFHIFIAALLWAQEWAERRPGKRTAISLLFGTIIVFNTIILYFTGTRGTTLGLIGGAILAGLIYIIRVPEARQVRNYVFGAIAILIVLSGILWAARDTQQVKDVGFLVRLANISIKDPTIQSRFLNIGMAWQGFQERPLLGWGQENYAVVFDKYYNPRMYTAEPWFDRVHNSIFDWLVAGGLLGLLAYLSIFAATLWALWRSTTFRIAEGSILIGLIAAYFFHNLFVFDNILSYMLFVTVLAYIAWRDGMSRKAKPVVETEPIPSAALPFAALGAVIVIGALGWYANAAAIDQNKTLIKALIDGSQGRYEESYADFERSISIGALGTQEAREQLAQAATQAAGAGIPADLKQRFFGLASKEMLAQATASPMDARFPLFLGMLFDAYGNYGDGRTSLERARELSPTKQTIYLQLAQNASSRGDTAGMLNYLKAAYDILPSNMEVRLFYTAALIRLEQDALASEILAPALATGEAADARIAQAYASRGQYDKIVEVWEARIAAMPDDAQSYFTLSAAYYAAGNSAKAITTLETIAARKPEFAAQAQTYIEQIRTGTAPKAQ